MNLKFLTHLKGQPQFRLKQIKQAVFVDLYDSWDQVSTLPKSLKTKLSQSYPLKINAQILESADQGSTKIVITLKDELKIESVLMRHQDGRCTVCVSSQVGCPLACEFCATGQMGFERNLTSGEIVEQVIFFARLLKKENKRVTNLVFMGMGEPLLNYKNLLEAIQIIHDPQGFNLGMRHISISTIGIIPRLQEVSQDLPQANLAISLHAPNDDLRQELMPATAQYALTSLLKSIDEYTRKTNRRVMFEYMLLAGINDTPEHAVQLAELIKTNYLYFVNLIKYNPTDSDFKVSSKNTVDQFMSVLEQHHVQFTQRYGFGKHIHAACGQLAGNNSL